jgi:DNA-binding PadR family transcriptional regulator
MARLDERGLIEALDPDARRRPYGITPAGVKVLEQSLDHLGHVVDEGRQRLALTGFRSARVVARPRLNIGKNAP